MSLRSRLSAVPRFYIDIAYLFVAEVLWVVGLYMYKGLLPVYINTYVRDPRIVSFIQSIGNVTGILAIVSGYLCKKVNVKWLLVLCWGVTVPAPLIFAFATNTAGFIAGQFLFSLTAAFVPAVMLYIFEYDFPGNKLSVYLLYSMVSSCASILSPTLGGFTATALGMRPTLLIAFALFAVGTLFTMFMSPAKKPPNRAEAVSVGEKKEPFNMKAHFSRYGNLYAWMVFLLLLPAIENISEPVLSLYLADMRGMTSAQIGYGYTAISLGAMPITLGVKRVSKTRTVLTVLAGLCTIHGLANIGLLGSGLKLLLGILLLRGAQNSTLFFTLGKFTELAEGDNKGMFVAVFIAARSLLSTLANNLGGVLYKVNAWLPFGTEIAALGVWLAAFSTFWHLSQRRKDAQTVSKP